MLKLIETNKGVLLPVHARPGARREGIGGLRDGRLNIAVTEVANGGKANPRLCQVLARGRGLKLAQVPSHSGRALPGRCSE